MRGLSPNRSTIGREFVKPRVHFFGGQGIGWALDEDLAQARSALEPGIEVGTFAASSIVLSAWWPPLVRMGRRALGKKTILCFADNPPAFYLTVPGFDEAAARVDLWIARSEEALGQFRELGLPVALAPYTVDAKVFHPLADTDRNDVRAELGLVPEDFVVGNFHRDSLGADLTLPKVQKGPNLFVEIVEQARERIPHLKVLLAGPRRHWLRRELAARGIPFVFRGEVVDGDDYRVNILDRRVLNRLYGALDAVVISSRWEGGPYSVLESIFAGRPVISTRVGMAGDLLGGWLFDFSSEAVKLLELIEAGGGNFDGIREGAMRSHSASALGSALAAVIKSTPRQRRGFWEQGESFFWSVMSRAHPSFRGCLGLHKGVSDAMGLVRERKPDGRHVIAAAVSIAEAQR